MVQTAKLLPREYTNYVQGLPNFRGYQWTGLSKGHESKGQVFWRTGVRCTREIVVASIHAGCSGRASQRDDSTENWLGGARFASTKNVVDLSLFETLRGTEETGIASVEIAKASKANPVLISWTMKHLVAVNFVGETGPDIYTATPISDAFTEPKYRDGIYYTPSFHQIPAYLKSISYRHPADIANGPFQYAYNTASPFFVWLQEKPEFASCFSNYMSGYRVDKISCVDPGFYPVEETSYNRIRDSADEVLLVDAGGSLGHDLELLMDKHIVGRLILQDTAQVIGLITEPDTVSEKMPHDNQCTVCALTICILSCMTGMTLSASLSSGIPSAPLKEVI
ncbi:MAG: hypothetical protein L6R42_000984 [Xanthoria sp. 1 TBL-2021]|nr:MAG: hypothetical protein L6R42_000984 [Xanthoria sp. 1 TBL-2021]